MYRTAYLGVVTVWYRGNKIHIAPVQPWAGYTSNGAAPKFDR